MSSKEEKSSDLTDTILHCSTLVCDTLVRMADMVTLTLLYHPGIDERNEKMKQLYENVINFIDDITSSIYQPQDSLELSINQYDPIFFHLKNVSKLMIDLIALLSQEHIEMQLQTMEYFYNMNKFILNCINILNSLVHASLQDIQFYDKTEITNVELGANELYRFLLRDLPESAKEWKNAFTLYLVGEKMSAIVFHCCEAGKKIYAARFAAIGLTNQNPSEE